MIRKYYETIVNVLFGNFFYNNVLLPRKKKLYDRSPLHTFHQTIVLLSFDIDGPKDIEKIPYLLKILQKYGISVSFAVIGTLVREHPEIITQIIASGHELINHTYTHPNSVELGNTEYFDKISYAKRKEEIELMHKYMEEEFNYTMKGFRTPHFGNQFTADIYPLLAKLQYRYSSSTVGAREQNGGYPYMREGVWELPVSCCPKHPFCIFDTSHSFRAKTVSHTSEEYISLFRQLLAQSKDTKYLNIYHDPQDIDKLDYELFLNILSDKKYNVVTSIQFTEMLNEKNNHIPK